MERILSVSEYIFLAAKRYRNTWFQSIKWKVKTKKWEGLHPKVNTNDDCEPTVHLLVQKGESGQRKDIKVKTKFLMLLLFRTELIFHSYLWVSSDEIFNAVTHIIRRARQYFSKVSARSHFTWYGMCDLKLQHLFSYWHTGVYIMILYLRLFCVWKWHYVITKSSFPVIVWLSQGLSQFPSTKSVGSKHCKAALQPLLSRAVLSIGIILE